jgi:hypothetical protein
LRVGLLAVTELKARLHWGITSSLGHYLMRRRLWQGDFAGLPVFQSPAGTT